MPLELFDAQADVWTSSAAYRVFCSRHGYRLQVAERQGRTTSAANRRRHAAGQFALRAGLLAEGTRLPDWNELRRLGLLPEL